MAQIHLEHVGHAYSGKVGGPYALEPADIVFGDGRSYALLGPSGCGKTTMLNIISGLVRPSEGRVLLDGRDVTGIETANRNIAQVFQFPVIYQAKSVFDNLAFPLRCRGWQAARIRSRVEEVAALLDLGGRLGRPAHSLTADEKQLISLGRGLVREDVQALLMDEPLTVIDPQLKAHLRRKLKEINERAKLTVIYVTHDQNEAMTFAKEVLVMSAGKVVQRGSPADLFERPQTIFVGTPGMNFLDAEITSSGVSVGGIPVPVANQRIAVLPREGLKVGFRPEYVTLAQPGAADAIPATVVGIQDQGSTLVVEIAIGRARARMKVLRSRTPPSGSILVHVAEKHLGYYHNDQRIHDVG